MRKNPKACVIGDPIAHSLSPLLHQTWLRQTKTIGKYSSVQIKAKSLKSEVLALFADPNFVGANITLPHKQSVLSLADEITPIAKQIGAANLLIRKNNKILADNTDAQGFLEPLLNIFGTEKLERKKVLVFGAGGAARAVLVALISAGVKQIWLCNRSTDNAKILLQQIMPQKSALELNILKWPDRNQSGCLPDIVVNASSAGMTGFSPLDVNLSFCHSKTLIYDLVYQPEVTPLIKQANAKCLQILGGLDMLISQARPCFTAFFGAIPPSDNLAKQILLQAVNNPNEASL